MGINIDVQAWVVGSVFVLMGFLMYTIATPALIQIQVYANSGVPIDPTALSSLSFIMSVWLPICALISLCGLIYIILSSIRQEVEQRYG